MTPGRIREAVGGVKAAIVRRHKPDYQIVLFMGILMLLGLVIMYAIGPQRANVLNNAYDTQFYNNMYFFLKQTLSLGVAVAAFVFMAVVPYEKLFKHSGKILFVGFLACAVLAVLGMTGSELAQCSLGACRWFDLGQFGSLQPAEFLKLGVLLFLAGFLGARAQQGLINDFNKTLMPVGIVLGLCIIFVIGLQEDMGTGISILAIIVSMVIVAGLKWRIVGLMVTLIVAIGVVFILIAPHRIERVLTYIRGDSTLNAEGDAKARNYHINHAKIAIGSGGLLGVGIGNSVQATGYLPEAINDSVFAIMGETFGFVGLMSILLLFLALLLRLLKISDHLVDMRLRLAAVGVFAWVGSHVVLNVAAMTGIFPLTGITLPLLSFGGTSMIFTGGVLGLAFQMSRYTVFGSKLVNVNEKENSASRRGIGRTRNATRRSNP